MATLQAHGGAIGVIEFLVSRIAVCADGHILRDHGDGWKLFRRVKEPETPEAALKRRQGRAEQFLRERPCYAAFDRSMRELADGFKRRAQLYTLLELMPDDIDGLASEAQDQGYELSLEDAKRLCDDYRLAKLEASGIQQVKSTVGEASEDSAVTMRQAV